MEKPNLNETLETMIDLISRKYSFLFMKGEAFASFKDYMYANIDSIGDYEEFKEHANLALEGFHDIHLGVNGIGNKKNSGNELAAKLLYNFEVTDNYLKNIQKQNSIVLADTNDSVYIRLNSFNPSITPDFLWLEDKLQFGKDRYIIDLRANGGGSGQFGYNLAAYLLKQKNSFLSPSTIDEQRLAYCFRERIDESDPSRLSDPILKYVVPQGYNIDNKVVILTSEKTASAAELATLFLSVISGSKIVGSKTCGGTSGRNMGFLLDGPHKGEMKDSDKKIKEYGANLALNLPLGLIYTPSGLLVQNNGIPPDIEINQDYSIINNRDLVLEKALELMKFG